MNVKKATTSVLWNTIVKDVIKNVRNVQEVLLYNAPNALERAILKMVNVNQSALIGNTMIMIIINAGVVTKIVMNVEGLIVLTASIVEQT